MVTSPASCGMGRQCASPERSECRCAILWQRCSTAHFWLSAIESTRSSTGATHRRSDGSSILSTRAWFLHTILSNRSDRLPGPRTSLPSLLQSNHRRGPTDIVEAGANYVGAAYTALKTGYKLSRMVLLLASRSQAASIAPRSPHGDRRDDALAEIHRPSAPYTGYGRGQGCRAGRRGDAWSWAY